MSFLRVHHYTLKTVCIYEYTHTHAQMLSIQDDVMWWDVTMNYTALIYHFKTVLSSCEFLRI